MTPSLGQGGYQAVEGGVVLAHHAAPGGDLAAGPAGYSAERVPRTTDIAAGPPRPPASRT
ncbi:hypothetical protein GKQ77_31415 [Streptomyces sp. BG9H]|uniref:Uncharacterized protein n=1 Tax=Streptomyces anatolicus TaxID=2675858 RepID=A0ABS6YX31_9ACTN|nr:hypothetical protein [Streptomyces anatolicus]MBW5426016.1 hypothetical protein [Streptomyces anatolicus]